MLLYARSLACGCLFALPFLVPSLWWISWVATITLLAIIWDTSPWYAFKQAWCFGFAFYALAMYWLPQTMTRFGGLPGWLALFLVLALNALGALQFGLFGYLLSRLQLHHGRRILLIPAVWVMLELLWPCLFPWRLGHTQYAWLGLIQIAEFTGVYGVSFFVMWSSVLIGLIIRAGWVHRARGSIGIEMASKHGAPLPGLKWHVLGGVAVMCLVLAFGWWRTFSLERSMTSRPSLRVALIQPGYSNRLTECRQRARAVHDRVDLICWPESSIGGAYPLAQTELGSEAARRRPFADPRCYLLFGAGSLASESPKLGPYYNTAFLLDREERIMGRYHKRKLMPFGEYIPGEQWFSSLHRFSPFQDRYAAGSSADPLQMPGQARLGLLICYEDLLSGLARALVNQGADVLVNLTNDAWFGQSAALSEHQRLALFRAIENRRYLLRCTVTGSTSVISPTGRVIAQAPLYEPGTLETKVHTMNTMTFYTRWGDLFAWACVAGVLLTALRRRYSGRHAQRA